MTYANTMVKYLTDLLPENANLIYDVGKNLNYCTQSSIIKKDTKVYMSAGLGTMGYAIPASIGAYQGNMKPTFVFTGDGGAQMNIQELNTIVKNKLPIKIFVFNNRALGNIVMFQDVTFDKRHYATMEKENDYFSCDFYKIAEAYGMKGIYIDDYKKIVDYKNDLESNEPVLFDIAYEDCEALPGIVAGGDYINGGKVILNKELQDKVKELLK